MTAVGPTCSYRGIKSTSSKDLSMKRWLPAVLLLLVVPISLTAQARGPKKEFAVAPDRAISVTREVLVRQGFEVVRIEIVGNDIGRAHV